MIGVITGIVSGISKLGSSWIDSKSKQMQARADIELAKAKHAADWDTEAMRQMQHSWKDEIFMIVWLSPIIVAWFDEEASARWIKFVAELPSEWWLITFAMVAATFGVRWLFSKAGTKVIEKKVGTP